MTSPTPPDMTPPPFLVEGATVHFIPDARPTESAKQDWRLRGAENCAWLVKGVKVDRRRYDDAHKLYVTLQSIERMEGLAFMTIPYDPATMQVTPPPRQEPRPQVAFPEIGARVVIEESADPANPSFRDGLWEIRKAFHEAAADGSGRQELKLSLASVGRKNQAYLKAVFNPLTMKPVVPDFLQDGGMVNVETQRDIEIRRLPGIRKRTVSP